MAKMTIAQCKSAVYQLINQYSIAGTEVPLTYNDQADNNNRMLNLINDAQMTIATTSRPIEETYTIEVPEKPLSERTLELEKEMPDDFIYALGVYFKPNFGDRRWIRVPERTIDMDGYKWIGHRHFLYPDRPAGTWKIEYARYPQRYDSTTPETTELDNEPDTHEAIPYYVAALLLLDENPYAYSSLHNLWETKLTRLGYKPPHATSTRVADVYGFDFFRGTW